MGIYVGLLRGINVGGHQTVAMSELRDHLIGEGFTDVRTLLQSGNVVFSSKKKPKIESVFGADFIVRTADAWREIVARNPFPHEAKNDPGRLVVMTCNGTPDASALKIVGREYAKSDGKQLYVVYPDGQGRSKLTNAVIERQLGLRCTARNWNTVMKILAAIG
jgi:uncharacterized protein (DUF1697 family)